MRVFTELSQWLAWRDQLATPSLGLVTTMGNLHQGHAYLCQRSLDENETTVVSIFVNPTQFNQPEDFANYPKTIDQDIELLSSLGVQYCLIPEPQDIYRDNYAFQIHESQNNLVMEGKFRPGHFNGVLTVVMKLFQLVKPQKAYFGEKDYQQLLLIKDMVEAFFLPIDIIACPTIREPSGLALSSRNNRLNAEEKKIAAQFASIFHGNKTIEEIRRQLDIMPLEVDYLEEHYQRRFAAIKVGNVRLIDNYLLQGYSSGIDI